MAYERAVLPPMGDLISPLRMGGGLGPNGLRVLRGQYEKAGLKWPGPISSVAPPYAMDGEKERQRVLTEDENRIYGCCNLFDLCNDELMGLSFKGQEPFLDWLGWSPSIDCIIQRDFIHWVRPEYSQGSPTGGYVSDPCEDRNGMEWGTCDFRLEDFGRIGRTGPVRDVSEHKERLCVRQPRYRLDGTPINSDAEFDMRVSTEGILQDLKRLIVTGNANTAGQWDGLERLVKTGYTDSAGYPCEMMDSMVIDWNSNPMAGGAGMTWNGAAMNGTPDIVAVLLAMFRRMRQRIAWAPALAAQTLGLGDMVIVAPTQHIQCILDFFTCWRVCDGDVSAAYSINGFNADQREFRDSLIADTPSNMFGAGYITLDGTKIPLIAYDWELIKGPTRGDIYFLTGAVGNVKTINGEWLDMSGVQEHYEDYRTTDGGRFIWWQENENTCAHWSGDMRPRMLMWAPFLQGRIQDVVCEGVTDPISPDPTDTSYFPESSFVPAECSSF